MTVTYKNPQQLSTLSSTNAYQPLVQHQPQSGLQHLQTNQYQHHYSPSQYGAHNYQAVYGLSQSQLGYNYFQTPYQSPANQYKPQYGFAGIPKSTTNQYKPYNGYEGIPKTSQYKVTNLYQPYQTKSINKNLQERFLH